MEVLSFNINGLRAAEKKGLSELVHRRGSDIVCLQEIKIDEEAIQPYLALFPGYTPVVSHAEKKGYSGVLTLSKAEPLSAQTVIGIPQYDGEGRFVRTDFDGWSLINAYFPSGTTGDVRQEVKEQFLEDMYAYCAQALQTQPNLVVVGDYNICHTEIDIHNPAQQHKTSGFLPHERKWVTQFLELGFVDSFRAIHPDEVDRYSWWSYRAGARGKNKGWRIDYQMVSTGMQAAIADADILHDVHMSDHAPTLLKLAL